MPVEVSIVTGRASAHLAPGENFVWVNPTDKDVTLSGCSDFCTQDSYLVSKYSGTSAQVNSNPTGWGFGENPSVWSPNPPVPGQPHIINPAAANAA